MKEPTTIIIFSISINSVEEQSGFQYVLDMVDYVTKERKQFVSDSIEKTDEARKSIAFEGVLKKALEAVKKQQLLHK